MYTTAVSLANRNLGTYKHFLLLDHPRPAENVAFANRVGTVTVFVGSVKQSTSVLPQAQSGVSYLPSSGSTTLEDGQTEAIVLVDVESGVFIRAESTFTLTLVAVAFIGTGGSF